MFVLSEYSWSADMLLPEKLIIANCNNGETGSLTKN